MRIYKAYGRWISRLRAVELLERLFYFNGHFCLGVNGPQKCKCKSLDALESREVSEEEHLLLVRSDYDQSPS